MRSYSTQDRKFFLFLSFFVPVVDKEGFYGTRGLAYKQGSTNIMPFLK